MAGERRKRQNPVPKERRIEPFDYDAAMDQIAVQREKVSVWIGAGGLLSVLAVGTAVPGLDTSFLLGIGTLFAGLLGLPWVSSLDRRRRNGRER